MTERDSTAIETPSRAWPPHRIGPAGYDRLAFDHAQLVRPPSGSLDRNAETPGGIVSGSRFACRAARECNAASGAIRRLTRKARYSALTLRAP
jgi:hypothetical protein